MTDDVASRRTPDDGVDSTEATPSSRVGGGRAGRVALLVLAFLALVTLTRGLLVETFTVPTASMEPTLSSGDRIAVWKHAGEVRRGDVVVFDGTSTFGPDRDESPATGPAGVIRSVGDALGLRPGEAVYVKRVIGVGGDRVRMDSAGRVQVNGRPVPEPYADVRAAGAPFDVAVPPGRLWVMGDRRGDSDDSRSHLGAPGGGTIRADDVIGEVVGRYWPLTELGGLPSRAAEHQGAPR